MSAASARYRINETRDVIIDVMHVKWTEHGCWLNKLWVTGNLLQTHDQLQCFSQHQHWMT